MGEDARGEDRERAPAGAEIERAQDPLRIAEQGAILRKRGHQQFADEAARHDDALVDIEGHALDVSAVEKIGGGLAGGHARFDQPVDPPTLAWRQFRVEERVERVDRQMEALEDEIGRLVERGRRAVAEDELGLAKAADRVAQPVARRDEEGEALVGFGHVASRKGTRPAASDVSGVDFRRKPAPVVTAKPGGHDKNLIAIPGSSSASGLPFPTRFRVFSRRCGAICESPSTA